MSVYHVTIERTITAVVEVAADDPAHAVARAQQRADTGDYDDVWDDLAADARHWVGSATEIVS